MAVLDIITFPDKRLVTPVRIVESINGFINKLIEDMARTMYFASGVGLAANQVGEDCRLVVYDTSPDGSERGKWEALINPVIVEQEGEIVNEEGCLSIIEFRSEVQRAARVCVRAIDREGNPIERECEGLLSVVMQHEIDHLSGTLFIDHISRLKRNLYIKRRMKQIKKDPHE